MPKKVIVIKDPNVNPMDVVGAIITAFIETCDQMEKDFKAVEPQLEKDIENALNGGKE